MDLGILFFLFHTLQVLTATKIRYWRNAIDSFLFKQWLHNLQSQIGILADCTLALRQVLIKGVDMFGKRIGFLKFKVPGIVFARGPVVTVLILLESDGETYAVLTEQARVPTGRIILELPAGMLDDDKGDFVGTAVREVEGETGIKFQLEDMVDLTAFLDSSTGCRFFPSPIVDYKRPTYEEVMRTSKPYFQGSAISAKCKLAKWLMIISISAFATLLKRGCISTYRHAFKPWSYLFLSPRFKSVAVSLTYNHAFKSDNL
ncbi:hypothetical protein Ahy_B01g056545 [Arachis hypogaea]|uniref:Nudix hydrolase domain-containing protein n=1 Tax=Arachis hypogaea TaxID=3818 RepID=A0A445AZ23_ARAHY|nr:hypothetical protein Ahy_B01g056545 [Arachis hypogaea]